MSKIFVPARSEGALRQHGLPLNSNLALHFNFYTEWTEEAGDLRLDNSMLEKLVRASELRETNELGRLLSAERARQIQLLQDLAALGYHAWYTRKGVNTDSRVAVGMGNPNPRENGLTFHYPLGFPIIPATSQKGIAGEYGALYEAKSRQEEAVRCILGDSEKGRGGVLFFDAFPIPRNQTQKLLETAVMTPHDAPYLGSEGVHKPYEIYDPIPILFLVVPRGVRFFFCMASRDKAALQTTWAWLQNGLYELGAGGKTRGSGYGRFVKEHFNDRVELKPS